MIGAIAGDIIGSVYEHARIKTKDFPVFHPQCTFTDDTVLTVAVAEAILTGRPYEESIRELGRRYPDAGYGGSNASPPRNSPRSVRIQTGDDIVLEYRRKASGLMNIFLQRKTTLNLLIIGIVIWLYETFYHILAFKETFLEALFLKVSIHDLYLRLSILLASCLLYLVLMKNRIIKDKEAQIENILNNVIPVCITNKDYEIIMANDSYWSIWGKPENRSLKCYEHRPGESCHTENCALTRVVNGAKEYVAESKKEYGHETHYFIVTARPFLDSKNKIAGIIESFQDITERRKLEDEKAKLIKQLQASLEKVKLLSGFIPICASCKKIRDDKGYWNQIETYIRNHSEAEFSHGICPDCARKLYPELDETVPEKKNR